MSDQTIPRAQIYYFLSHAFLYPQENWLGDWSVLEQILQRLDPSVEWDLSLTPIEMTLDTLQTQHREVFGLTGSLSYETEFGLPHEFRQSQELADIAGFYHAFGFRTGAAVRERPDHLATELEFMYLLALKEAYAAENALVDEAEICIDAQRKFLEDHLARWIGPFCRSLERSTDERLGEDGLRSPYVKLAHLAEAFISIEMALLGITVATQGAVDQKPTPFNPDYSCAGCAVAELNP